MEKMYETVGVYLLTGGISGILCLGIFACLRDGQYREAGLLVLILLVLIVSVFIAM